MDEFLGFNVGGHDSSVAYMSFMEGNVTDVSVYLSERISKIKHQGRFPFQAVQQFKKDSPDLWNRIANNHMSTNSFSLTSREVEDLFDTVDKLMIETFGVERATHAGNDELRFITHHLCHAYSALLQCPFEKAMLIVSDGAGTKLRDFGEGHPEKSIGTGDPLAVEYFSVYLMENGQLTPVEKSFRVDSATSDPEIMGTNSLGGLFEMVARKVFGDWSTAGKVMGLSAYGEPEKIKDPYEFITHMAAKNLEPVKSKKDFDLQPNTEFKERANLAASVQTYFESVMIDKLKTLRAKHPDFENLILVGGCALNCLLNSRILEENIYKRVFIPPFPNDEGISIGSNIALAIEKKKYKFQTTDFNHMTASLGPHKHHTKSQQHLLEETFLGFKISKPAHLAKEVADLLNRGEIVAWMQGRSEVGPRALGSRSILVKPGIPGIKQRLNETVKFRENFRPYGATILSDRTPKYFHVGEFYESPFMTFSPKVKDEYVEILEGIVHHDKTCRIQTLHRDQNPAFYDLLVEFEKIAGLPILLNTSLNIMGQPILESINDARVFMDSSAIKILVYGDYIVQP